MADPRDDLRNKYRQLTDLRAFPEVAKRIGTYIARFGQLELSLYHLYGIVIGTTNEAQAMRRLGSESLFSQISWVKKELERRGAAVPFHKDADLILEAAKIVLSFRNKIAHGTYLTDDARSQVFLHAYIADTRKVQPPAGELTTEHENFFEIDVARLEKEIWLIDDAEFMLERYLRRVKPQVFGAD